MGLRLKDSIRKKLYMIIVIAILAFIGLFSIKSVVTMIKQKTNIEYKLEHHGYNEKDIKILKKHLDNKDLTKLLDREVDKNIPLLLEEKYYIEKNLDQYLTYLKENKNTSVTKAVSYINTRANEKWYTNPVDTDLSKGNLILVNKFNKLGSDYTPELVNVSNWYSYGENKLTKEAYEAFINMFNGAKDAGTKIVATSCFRSYDTQKRIYDTDVYKYGEEQTDESVAKPGFSEHQTGLAIDLLEPGYSLENFHESTAYTWLLDNAYRFGFILRYPSDKEDITGYSYESWHFRYVGLEAAKIIHDNNITFDEYYAYYIAK